MILNNKFWVPIVLAILFLINWAASVFHSRIDLTGEKRFTVSSATKKLLKTIDEPVSIDVFLKGNYPSGFKKLASSTQDLLNEFKEIAGNKIKYRFLSPDENVEGTSTTYGDSLSALGLYPINLTSQVKEGQQQQFVYPVALVHYKDTVLPVMIYKGKSPLISFSELNSAEAMLEFNIANAIAKIIQKEKPVVAYATGNGEPQNLTVYDLVENTLKTDYTLFVFNLKTQPFIPQEFKLFIIVKPTEPFTDEEKLKLDQYVMNGGKLLMFIDRLNSEMDSLQIKNEVIAYDRELQLNDLAFKYGVRMNADLIMDLQCDQLPFDINGNGQYELLAWNYFPVLESKSNHPINKNVGFIAGRFVNSMDTVEAEGIRKTILLNSSVNARTIGTPALISGKENVNAPEDEKFKKQYIPAAVLLEGKFQSLYANRVSQSMVDSLQKYNTAFLPKCINDTKIIIVSDGDIILNSIAKANQPIPMGMNPYTFGSEKQFPFANKDFLQNCMDYLIDQNGLSEAKSKDYTLRLLNTKKVEEEKTFWQIINILVPIAAVILFALFYQWHRKRKYSK